MALARYDPFFRRQADRLFGSVVRLWFQIENSDEVAIFFACGCHYTTPPPRARWFCRRHKRQKT